MTKHMSRRRLLASTAVFVTALSSQAFGRTYSGGVLPWDPSETQPPKPVRPGPWLYFTADEVAAVEDIVDRLIPPDDSGPGGKEAGCAVFIDRQLVGSFGDSRRLYRCGKTSPLSFFAKTLIRTSSEARAHVGDWNKHAFYALPKAPRGTCRPHPFDSTSISGFFSFVTRG